MVTRPFAYRTVHEGVEEGMRNVAMHDILNPDAAAGESRNCYFRMIVQLVNSNGVVW